MHEYRDEVIAEKTALPTCWDRNDLPMAEKLETGLEELKKGKAGGRSGTVPEMILYGGAELWDRCMYAWTYITSGRFS